MFQSTVDEGFCKKTKSLLTIYRSLMSGVERVILDFETSFKKETNGITLKKIEDHHR